MKKLTIASLRSYYEFENSMTNGNSDPNLLQDYFANSQLGIVVANGLGITLDEKTKAPCRIKVND